MRGLVRPPRAGAMIRVPAETATSGPCPPRVSVLPLRLMTDSGTCRFQLPDPTSLLFGPDAPLGKRLPRIQADILDKTFRASRGLLSRLALATLVASACTVAGPVIFADAVGRLGAGQATLTGLVLAFLLFALVHAATRVLGIVTWTLSSRIEHLADAEANRDSLAAILAARPSFLAANNPARISSLIGNLKESNRELINMGCLALLGSLTDILFAAAAIAAYVDWTVAACVLGYGLASIWLTLRSNSAARMHQTAAVAYANDGANVLGNLSANAATIRLFRAEGWARELFDRFTRDSQARWNAFLSARLRYDFVQAALVFVQYGGIFALILIRPAPPEVLAQQIVMVSLLLVHLNRPFEMVSMALKQMEQSREQARPLQVELDQHRPLSRHGQGRPLPGSGPIALDLVDVGCRYPGQAREALAGVTVGFRPGRVNYIVGPSGAGKSTLLAILLGTVAEQRGSITVDGALALHDIGDDAWLTAIGHVPQEPMLMNLSLRENIAFGREVDDAAIHAVLERVHLAAKVAALPEGLDFEIGERGQRLSVGERQRVAIARALIGRPRLLLLDEASSALDEATERGVFATLRELADDTTVIAITHRLGIIEADDSVLTVEPADADRRGRSLVTSPA